MTTTIRTVARRANLATSAALSGALLLTGCDLDKTNPNAPTQQATLASPDGVIAVAVGLQSRFGTSTGAFIYAAGLVTDELAAVSAALVTISDAETGVVTQGAGFLAHSANAFCVTLTNLSALSLFAVSHGPLAMIELP